MNLKKAGIFVATCVASAALTVLTLQFLNEQFHIRDRLGLTTVNTPVVRR